MSISSFREIEPKRLVDYNVVLKSKCISRKNCKIDPESDEGLSPRNENALDDDTLDAVELTPAVAVSLILFFQFHWM